MQPVRGFDPAALRRLRNQRGLTQAELADHMGVARTYAIQWERQGPDGTAPSPGNLVRLAQLLQVEPHRLTTIDPSEALLGDLRHWQGLSQAELADKAGIATSTLATIELATRPLHDRQAEAIAAALDTSPARVRAAHERARSGRASPHGS